CVRRAKTPTIRLILLPVDGTMSCYVEPRVRMNLHDWYKSFVEFLQWDVKRLAAFLTGVIAALIGVFVYVRFVRRKARAESGRRILELTRANSELTTQLARAQVDAQSAQAESRLANTQAHALRAEVRDANDELTRLTERLAKGIAGGKRLVVERNNLQVKVEELSEACDGLKTELANLDNTRQDLAKEKDALAGR